MAGHNYAGTWILLPELSFYQDGAPPQAARYEIGVTGKNVEFLLHWTTNGDERSVRFSGPLDGTLHPSDIAPNSQIAFTHVDADTLESVFVVNDVQMAFARRQVSRDGTLLAVLQVNRNPDGTSVRITQVYRRSA